MEYMIKKEAPIDEDTEMIQCDICNSWYHHSCVNLSIEQVKELSRPDVMWLCTFKEYSDVYGDILESDCD